MGRVRSGACPEHATRAAFRAYFSKLAPSQGVIETGTHSGWVAELLRELGHEVRVASSRRLRLRASSTSWARPRTPPPARPCSPSWVTASSLSIGHCWRSSGGRKALRRAVKDVFGERAVIQRCQVHKVRNVTEHLPERERARGASRIRDATRCGDAERAKRLLKGLARQLETEHPGAAGSLREGLGETLTVMTLGIQGALPRTLSSTNAIENLNGLLRVRLRNVKRCRGGKMVLRWVVAGLEGAKKCFRRIRGQGQMQELINALNSAANNEIETIREAG